MRILPIYKNHPGGIRCIYLRGGCSTAFVSKADIRNPLSLLAHERSRFAYSAFNQWLQCPLHLLQSPPHTMDLPAFLSLTIP